MSNDSLAELFARDPFSYTKEDIDRIILYYRESRSAYNVGGRKEVAKINLAELGMADAPKLTPDILKRNGK